MMYVLVADYASISVLLSLHYLILLSFALGYLEIVVVVPFVAVAVVVPFVVVVVLEFLYLKNL